MGDVKMLAMIGAFLGWKLMLLTLVLSSFAGSLVGVALIVTRRGDLKYALPFGTFLAAGAVLAGFPAGPPVPGVAPPFPVTPPPQTLPPGRGPAAVPGPWFRFELAPVLAT